jgi:hypothetical protein
MRIVGVSVPVLICILCVSAAMCRVIELLVPVRPRVIEPEARVQDDEEGVAAQPSLPIARLFSVAARCVLCTKTAVRSQWRRDPRCPLSFRTMNCGARPSIHTARVFHASRRPSVTFLNNFRTAQWNRIRTESAKEGANIS